MTKYRIIDNRKFLAALLMVLSHTTVFAQDEWEQGELESVEIEIVKERQITLPPANRNFGKIPPRPAEDAKAPVRYDFRPFSFQTPQVSPSVRPLRLKQPDAARVYGAHISAGYGNYSSPYLEGFFNSKRDKNKLIGAHAFLNASGKGPVDGANSASGTSGISLYGRSFTKDVSLRGDLGFENRTTHFYGYVPGTVADAEDIRQSYNHYNVSADLSNTRNTAFAYKLGGAFEYMTDRFAARESEINASFDAAYTLNPQSSVGMKAEYAMISRTDEQVEPSPRNLLTVNPSFVFYPVEGLRMRAGIVAAFEDDTIGGRNVHAYPDIRISYPLSPSVEVVAALTGGIEKVSLQSLSRENLWLDANIPLFHTNKLYDLQAALHTRIGNKVSADGGFSFAALKNWYFHTNHPDDQSRFIPEYDSGTSLRTNFFASLGFVQTRSAKFLLRGDFYLYRTDEIAEAWHRPAYKVTGDIAFNVYQKLLIDIDVILQGGVKAKRYTSPATFEAVDLDPAVDINGRLEYIVSGNFSVFAQAYNVISNQYPVYLNYPVRGFQMLGGITVKL